QRRHGEHQLHARSGSPDRGGRLPVDTAQGRLPYAVPDAAPVPDAPRRLPSGGIRLPTARAAPRSLLHRLLLGAYGALVCGRCYERALDRAARVAYPVGETFAVRALDCADFWHCFSRGGGVDVIFGRGVIG